MPIKTIKKVIWGASGFFSLLLCGALFVTFFVSAADAQKIPELPPQPKRESNDKTTLIQLGVLWQTDFNAKPPTVRQITRTPQPVRVYQAPKLESILPRHLQIHSILNDNFAIVIHQRKKIIMRPFNQKQEDTFLDLGDEDKRPWEISIPGKKLILHEISFEKGILFKTADEKEEGWLKLSTAGSRGNLIRKIPRSRKVGENQWIVTRDEARKMYENYDKYIGEMALKPHSDGIWVRRVPEDSKAAFYGLQKNDIVVDFNGTPLKIEELSSKNNIRKLAKKYRKMKSFRLNIIRNGQKMALNFDKP